MKKINILLLLFVICTVSMQAEEIDTLVGAEVQEAQVSVKSNKEDTKESLVQIGTLIDGTMSYEVSDIPNTLDYTSSDILLMDDQAIFSNKGALIINTDKSIPFYANIDSLNSSQASGYLTGKNQIVSYVGTTEIDGEIYFKINVNDIEYITNTEELILKNIDTLLAYNHYVVTSGELIYKEAIDPINSNEYTSYNLGAGPDGLSEGVIYYSQDSVNFSTSYDSVTSRSTGTKAELSYFQSLPFRSSSDYTAQDYKNYLKSIGKTNSVYYNSTQAFVDAQELYNVNSLLLFSMANHESAYGTSYYSRTCNNFFGRSAFDSDPDQACIKVGYPTPRDGILAQAIYLKQEWTSIQDWRYYGGHAGNKSSGMNVKYATDPSWGVKLAAHATNVDKYLGSEERNKYRIYKTNANNVVVYNDASIKNALQTDGYRYYATPSPYNKDIKYTIDQSVYFVGLSESASSIEVQLDTAKNNEKTGVLTFTAGAKGSHPNYGASYGSSSDGTGNNTVTKGKINFAAKYGNWDDQTGYISKKNLTLVNNVKFVRNSGETVAPEPEPEVDQNSCSVLTYDKTNKDGNREVKYASINKLNECVTTYEKKTSTLKTKTDTKHITVGGNISSVDQTNYKSGKIDSKEATKYTYDSKGNMLTRVLKEYDSASKLTHELTNKYFVGTSNSSSYVQKLYSNGKVIKNVVKTYHSNYKQNETITDYYVNGKKTTKLRTIYEPGGKQTYDMENNYNSNGSGYISEVFDNKGIRIKRTESTTSSNEIQSIKNYYYDSKGAITTKLEETLDEDDKTIYKKRSEYKNKIVIKSDEDLYSPKGFRTKRNENEYHSNGKIKLMEVFRYKIVNNKSKLYLKSISKYNSSGKLYSFTEQNY